MRAVKNSADMSKLSKFVHSVRQEAKEMDEKALDNGKMIKYIFEIRRKGKLDLAFLYSDIHLTQNEALNRTNVRLKKGDDINIRGPFPLYDGALANSKIARWEREKERSEQDLILMDKLIEDEKQAGNKYIYFTMAKSYGVDRLVDNQASKSALPQSEVNKMLKKIYYGTGFVNRICLSNGKTKRYG
jgi:hypothetical protein